MMRVGCAVWTATSVQHPVMLVAADDEEPVLTVVLVLPCASKWSTAMQAAREFAPLASARTCARLILTNSTSVPYLSCLAAPHALEVILRLG
jgi:hypothetical protein